MSHDWIKRWLPASNTPPSSQPEAAVSADSGASHVSTPGVELIRELASTGEELCRLAFSPTGSHIAASRRGRPSVWELPSGTPVAGTELARQADIDWSDGGTRLAVDGERSIDVITVGAQGAQSGLELRLSGWLAALRWVPRRNSVVAGLKAGRIEVFDLNAPESPTVQLRAHEGTVGGLAIDLDGSRLASASNDGSLAVWDLETQRLLWRAEAAHNKHVTRVIFDPNRAWIASVGSDRTLAVWDVERGRLLHRAEGHNRAIMEVAVSHDGKVVGTVSWDQTIRLWRTDTWEEVACLPGFGPETNRWLGLAFHPTESILATIGPDGRSVRLWHLDVDFLLGQAPREGTVQYTNAKVVLVGDSGVGKTGLRLTLQGKPWRETGSTHARHIWTLSREESAEGGRQQVRETYLWDLAGQPGYRLVNQLHLGDVALALIVFDARSETDPLGGVRYWTRAIDQARSRSGDSSVTLNKLLVIGRGDRGGVPLSRERLEQVCEELGCRAVYATSAKEGRGIEDLKSAIAHAIDWNQLPRVSSNQLFVGIQRFLRNTKEWGLVLESAKNLFLKYLESGAHTQSRLDPEQARPAFETCMALIEGQGILVRLRFGDLVLLQPELLDAYAGAMVNAARDEPDGLGALPEDAAQQGNFRMESDDRVSDLDQERLLLIATVEHLLHHEVVFRVDDADDRPQLAFPAQTTRDKPELPEPEHPAGRFRFAGPTQNIYATLVVRLAHSTLFGSPELWRDAAEFSARAGGRCGVQLRSFGEGTGELLLFHDALADERTVGEFRAYVRAHLERRALPRSIEEYSSFMCTSCRTPVSDTVLRRRRERGHSWLDCPVCGDRVDLTDPVGSFSAAAAESVARIDEMARACRDRDRARQVVAGKRKLRDYDVFLCHNSAHKPVVKEVATRLCERGLLPWFDEWDLPPGRLWQDEIQAQIRRSKSVAVFVGNGGLGPWQDIELKSFLVQFANSGRPIIPVILSECASDPELPLFLQNYQIVDLRRSDPDPMDRLEWGVTGRRPSYE